MFTHVIKPRFSETDAFGHINNNSYGLWYESARHEIYTLFSSFLNKDKISLIMVHNSNDYLKETFWGIDAVVKTAVLNIGNSSLELAHGVYQHNILCTSSKAIFAHYNLHSKMAINIPNTVREELEKHIFRNQWPKKLEDLSEQS